MTWSAGAAVAGVAGQLGAVPVLAASFGVAGAVATAAVLTYGARAVAWWRAHPATVGVCGLVLLYVVFAAVLLWLRGSR